MNNAFVAAGNVFLCLGPFQTGNNSSHSAPVITFNSNHDNASANTFPFPANTAIERLAKSDQKKKELRGLKNENEKIQKNGNFLKNPNIEELTQRFEKLNLAMFDLKEKAMTKGLCFECFESGHIAKNCPRLKNEIRVFHGVKRRKLPLESSLIQSKTETKDVSEETENTDGGYDICKKLETTNSGMSFAQALRSSSRLRHDVQQMLEHAQPDLKRLDSRRLMTPCVIAEVRMVVSSHLAPVCLWIPFRAN